MNSSIGFSQVIEGMRCPTCNTDHAFFYNDTIILCESCREKFPIINGIPILIDETKSVFKKQDFISNSSLFFDMSARGQKISKLGSLFSTLTGETGKANFDRLRALLKRDAHHARVLVLGGSIAGQGTRDFLEDGELDIVESDVSFGPRTKIILDAHNIPYQNDSFDCVIVQAVLEHVLDPFECVSEIHRVLRKNGLVYSETPFMQQVHGGAYDFHRFTYSGHRRLFRHFEEIASGQIAGAGTVLWWSYQHLLLSLFGISEKTRLFVKIFSRLTGFWLKYLDALVIPNPYSIEGASCFYFIGRKSDEILTDKAIVDYYDQSIHRKGL